MNTEEIILKLKLWHHSFTEDEKKLLPKLWEVLTTAVNTYFDLLRKDQEGPHVCHVCQQSYDWWMIPDDWWQVVPPGLWKECLCFGCYLKIARKTQFDQIYKKKGDENGKSKT